MANLLSVKDLKRHFDVRLPGGIFGRRGTLKAVDGISFDIAPGETLGLVGESGCGKSTTARLVLGLTGRDGGEVLFEGQTVPTTRDSVWRDMRRRMQMVYQDPLGALDRRLPVGEQVIEPLVIFDQGNRAERNQKALSLFDAVGLPRHTFDRYPHELSGGQRQRVVLARALILNPSLLVCDEPISALDVSIQAQVINLLLGLQAEFGIAYLFISHDLKVVRQIAHRVAVMYLGKIVETGKPEQLFHAPMHPYTRALVSAVPNPRARGRQRIVLEGDPPSPVDVPVGCPFHPRCAFAVDRCRMEVPVLRDQSDGRAVACHLPDSVTALAA